MVTWLANPADEAGRESRRLGAKLARVVKRDFGDPEDIENMFRKLREALAKRKEHLADESK